VEQITGKEKTFLS